MAEGPTGGTGFMIKPDQIMSVATQLTRHAEALQSMHGELTTQLGVAQTNWQGGASEQFTQSLQNQLNAVGTIAANLRELSRAAQNTAAQY